MKLIEKINETLNYIRTKTDINPEIALVLGSGLGHYGDTLENKIEINYADIPHFFAPTVVGHAGKLIFGEKNGKKIVCMQGRFHYYEGHGIEATVYPIRLFAKMGVKVLFTTNATGGLNDTFKPGDFMVIKDHINFMGVNPLIGPNEEEFGTRFPDMTNIYTTELLNLAVSCGNEIGIDMKTGVMVGYSGPNYETPAEIQMFKMLGGDNVGMSTIPETIVARHSGLKVLSISSITNLAAGISKTPLDHKEVTEIANQMVPKFKELLDLIIERI